MEEQGCPRCKTTKYRNPSLKLLVNVCGHSLCESCVELLFVKGSGLCPECGTSLRRSTFRLQIFEDASVEKEIDIRKRVLRDFNKKEEDFPSLQEYNDYLEMIETIVFNLTNHQDVEATKKMIDQYKKENKDQIKKNLSKLSKDEDVSRNKVLLFNSLRKTNYLMYQDRPAHDIISSHKELTQHEELEAKRATTAFSTGIKIGHRSDIVPLNKQETAQLYRYCPLVIEWCGPEPPTVDELYTDGYNIRTISDAERAGGFREALACHRALQDAFSGLYSFPNISAPSPAKRKSFPQTTAHSPMITS
uniref:CDK-activating kinase assembly factor MAT1 n=1 Tax=Biomphalaria glabrata TaxID=6526 RepID=A0A2C9KT96_BIOGL